MKKILRLTRIMTLVLAVVMMLSSISVLTVRAEGNNTVIFPKLMQRTDDGRIKITSPGGLMAEDSTGRVWGDAGIVWNEGDESGVGYPSGIGYPFCRYTETEEVEVQKRGQTVIYTRYTDYLDCYLTDFIKTHDESEWPSIVVKGSDGVPFYFTDYGRNGNNCDFKEDGLFDRYYVKYGYDEASGFWLEDKVYKGPYVKNSTWHYKGVSIEEATENARKEIENGKVINGKAKKSVQPPKDLSKMVVITDDDTEPSKPDDVKPSEPSEPVNPPTEGEEITDPYADVNTLGATVKLSTDCIKVKKNSAAQKPRPKSVKVGKKTLKRNKTFVVSYEKYEGEWYEVNAVTDEGIYRLVITGKNGYDGVYKKRLYVTADKTIKAMSSASVSVNKMYYTGEPITSGVIKTAKVGKRVLAEGTDYTVTYANNINSGKAQVTLTAVEGSGLLGTKTVNFTINDNKMSKAKVKGIVAMTYSPDEAMKQDMSKVELTYGTKKLAENTDFTVTYANNTKAGTAKMVFTGKGIYNGTLTKTFKINKLALNDSMLDEASKNIKMAYTGKAVKPEVSLTYGNTALKKGTDYTLTYSNNVKESTDAKPAWIVVKGKGNYAGSFKVSFTIVPEADDTGAKPNAKINTHSAKEAPEEDDTVSGNSTTDETPAEDENVSESDTPDETPAEDETPAIDENPEENPEETPATDEDPEETPAEGGNPEETSAVDETTEKEPAEDETVSGNSLTEDTIEDEAVTEDETVSEEPVVEDDTVAEKVITLSVGTLIDCEDYDQYFESYDEKDGENTKFGETDDAKTEALRYVEEGKEGSYAVIMCEGKIICGFIKIDGNIIKY